MYCGVIAVEKIAPYSTGTVSGRRLTLALKYTLGTLWEGGVGANFGSSQFGTAHVGWSGSILNAIGNTCAKHWMALIWIEDRTGGSFIVKMYYSVGS